MNKLLSANKLKFFTVAVLVVQVVGSLLIIANEKRSCQQVCEWGVGLPSPVYYQVTVSKGEIAEKQTTKKIWLESLVINLLFFAAAYVIWLLVARNILVPGKLQADDLIITAVFVIITLIAIYLTSNLAYGLAEDNCVGQSSSCNG